MFGIRNPIEIIVILAIVLIFFGGRRIPEVMRGLGEGIRSFKEGMSGTSQPTPPPAAPAAPAEKPAEEKK
jgi:sec-independent protein translocase protein TatA